jgi:hypothetical protein
MEQKNQMEELEDEVHEAIVEAIDSKESMDDLKKAIGQTTLRWFLGNRQKREVARRKFFELRKAKRDEKPAIQK